MAARLRALPVGAWLAAIVLLSFALRAWLSRDMVAPFIFVDELIYEELGRSLAAQGERLIRDVPVTGYPPLYPALIAPAFALFDSLPDAYAAVKALNALVMSLAAVPAYAIARRVLAPTWSLAAAVFAVALPSLAYTGTVMTENLFYPLFLLTAWLLVVDLERPSWRLHAGVLAACLLAFFTRAQAAVLLPAVLTAPLLLAAYDPRALRATLRPFAPLYAAAAAAGAAVLAVRLAAGTSAADLLGAYGVVGERSYSVRGVAEYALWHAEELTLYLGVAPVAAALVVAALARGLGRPVQALVAATAATGGWLLLSVAAFSSQFVPRIQERNLFFVAPLVLVLLLVWTARGAPRPPRLALPAAAVAVLLPALFPYTKFIETGAVSDTLALLPIWSAFGSLLLDSIVVSVVVGAVAAAAAFLFVPARRAALVPALVLVWFLVVGHNVWFGERGFAQASSGALFQGMRAVPRDWVDTALPPGATAGIVWTGISDRFTVNQTEFFNRAVTSVYYVGAPTPGNLPETEITIGEQDGVLRRLDGTPLDERYLVTDGALELDAVPLARDLGLGTTLWRLAGLVPRTAEVDVYGLYEGDTWSGARVRYERRRCSGGTLLVPIHSDAGLFTEPQTVVARVGGRAVKRVRFTAPEAVTMRIPLTAVDGTCEVVFTISPTAVPADVLGTDDRRTLGVHFDGFAYRPPA